MDVGNERLRVEGLTKRYDSSVVVHDVNFTLRAGEITALLGPNGSGKTTIIKSILGLIGYDGVIKFNDRSVAGVTSYLEHVGAVLEGSRNVHWRLTVEQNASYFLAMRQSTIHRLQGRCLELMELLDIAQYRSTVVAKLSTGNRQKVALLCALVHDPQLVLMDEPTLGLDVETVRDLQNFVLQEAFAGDKAFLVTSHDLQFVDRICSRVIVIYDGGVVFTGRLEDLKARLHLYQVHLRIAAPIPDEFEAELAALNCADDVTVERSDIYSLTARFNNAGTAVEIASLVKKSALSVLTFESSRTSMEQAYKEILDSVK